MADVDLRRMSDDLGRLRIAHTTHVDLPGKPPPLGQGVSARSRRATCPARGSIWRRGTRSGWCPTCRGAPMMTAPTRGDQDGYSHFSRAGGLTPGASQTARHSVPDERAIPTLRISGQVNATWWRSPRTDTPSGPTRRRGFSRSGSAHTTAAMRANGVKAMAIHADCGSNMAATHMATRVRLPRLSAIGRPRSNRISVASTPEIVNHHMVTLTNEAVTSGWPTKTERRRHPRATRRGRSPRRAG